MYNSLRPSKSKISLITIITITFMFALTPSIRTQVIFFEDWESGIGNWSASNGIWEVGSPTVIPDSLPSGLNCAGTILNGNYPNNSKSRLESPISPEISLPTVCCGEKILLKFWHWFINSDDNGYLEISVNGGVWDSIQVPQITRTSNVWTQYVLDLSQYAGSSIRIGFLFISGSFNNEVGWYIDDIKVEKKTCVFINPEDFEIGVRDWGADNGLWQVGEPKVGPSNAHSDKYCAGTVLNGNYPNSSSTRFISPEIKLTLKEGETPVLYFWHWFRLVDDKGEVQISVNKGPWQTIAGPFTGTSPVWTQAPAVNLSAFADSTIHLGFYFQSGSFNVDNGWYIDDIRIDGIVKPLKGDVNFDGVVNEIDIHLIVDIILEKFIPTPEQFWAADCVADGKINILDVQCAVNKFLENAHLRIISPNGGESLCYDKPMTIEWDPSIISSKIKIEFSKDAGSNWTVLEDSTENDGNFEWIPSTDFESNECKARISAMIKGFEISDVFDESDAVFSIISCGNVVLKEVNRPTDFCLHQNFPNPFNPVTSVHFDLPIATHVQLVLLNQRGQQVDIIVDAQVPSGSHQVTIDGSNLPSGLYFYQLKTSQFQQTKKMLLLK